MNRPLTFVAGAIVGAVAALLGSLAYIIVSTDDWGQS